MIITDKCIPKGLVEITLENVKTGKKYVFYSKNLITNVGKASMADSLRGTTTGNKGIITYCAVGLSTTAPAPADTTLGDELFRKLVSVRSVSANVALFETFFTTSEANGVLREAGLFGDDASSTKDSGTLFSKLAIDRTKTTSDTLTVRWAITIG